MNDVLVRGGLMVDGSGAAARAADVDVTCPAGPVPRSRNTASRVSRETARARCSCCSSGADVPVSTVCRPLVRVIRVEQHDYACRADVAAAAAAESLRSGLGHAERITVVAVPVIDVRREIEATTTTTGPPCRPLPPASSTWLGWRWTAPRNAVDKVFKGAKLHP